MNTPANAPRTKNVPTRRVDVRRRAAVEALEDRLLYAAQPFGPRQFIPLDFAPRLIATGDLTGDGLPDIVAPIPADNVVIALLNNGDGTFTTHRSSVPFQTPRAVAIADFNGDGHADLAVSGTDANGDNVVAIYLGNGDGTFNTNPKRYFIASAGLAIAADDVNGDGSPDLVVTTGRRLTVLINNGDGTLQKPVYYNVGGDNSISDQPSSVALADFNHDGLPDIVTCLQISGSVSILLNNPADPGTFLPPVLYKVPGNPLAVTTGDFNGDGNIDLAVVGSGFQIRGINVLLGNGNGTFGPAVTYPGPYFADSIAAGTFTNSGHEDLIVGSFQGPLEYFAGNGDGTFATPVNIPGAWYTQNIQVADFNGDGMSDITVPSGGVKVFLNAGGNIAPPPPSGPSEQTIGGGGKRTFSFYALDGTFATATLNGPGTATLDFSGSSTIQLPTPTGTKPVLGQQISGISLTGTTAATTLTISTQFRSETLTVPTISADATVGGINAPTTFLSGDLTLAAGAGKVALGSAKAGTITVSGGTAPSFVLGTTAQETINSAVPLGSIRVNQDANLTLDAPSLSSLSVGGLLHDSSLTLTAAYAAGVLDLEKVNVAKSIVNLTINSTGNIGTIAAFSMSGSTIDAGVGPLPAGQQFPTLSDFVATASINAVRLGRPVLFQSFVNSNISAYGLGTLQLGTIQTSNNGTPFGVTAHTIGQVAGTTSLGQSFTLKNLNTPQDVQSQIAAKKLNLQDFVVQLV
ncbi:MAG TPA: VCBS repeat-containing protein [Tepidisphaeraceae bacterium]